MAIDDAIANADASVLPATARAVVLVAGQIKGLQITKEVVLRSMHMEWSTYGASEDRPASLDGAGVGTLRRSERLLL